MAYLFPALEEGAAPARGAAPWLREKMRRPGEREVTDSLQLLPRLLHATCATAFATNATMQALEKPTITERRRGSMAGIAPPSLSYTATSPYPFSENVQKACHPEKRQRRRICPKCKGHAGATGQVRANVSIHDRSFLPQPVPAEAGSRQDDKSSVLYSHSKEWVEHAPRRLRAGDAPPILPEGPRHPNKEIRNILRRVDRCPHTNP